MYIEITFTDGVTQIIDKVLSISKMLDKLQIDTSTTVYQYTYNNVLEITIYCD